MTGAEARAVLGEHLAERVRRDGASHPLDPDQLVTVAALLAAVEVPAATTAA